MPADPLAPPGAALITGAARRLGRAMALGLAADGRDVAIHYHGSADAAEATAAEARALGVRAVTLRADLLRQREVEALVPRAAAALGRIGVLVNSASIFERDDLASATAASWDRHIGTNLSAPLFLTQAFAAQGLTPATLEDEPLATGLVVNMIDQRVLKPTPAFFTYGIAKHGLWAMTRMAAQALAPAIRVNAIAPGPTMRGERQSDAHFGRQRAGCILGRGGDADDVVGALRYLVSAKSVTGQMILVDGGQHLGWQTPDIVGPL